jgi:activating signal cointegrator 1
MIYQALTIRQPWASLIAIGAKRFETRSKPPPAKHIGQRIAIHAALRRPKDSDCDHATWFSINCALNNAGIECASDLPLGVVVCTAILAGAYQSVRIVEDGEHVSRLAITMGHCENSVPPPNDGAIPTDPFGDYSWCRWAWLLTNIEVLAVPVPAGGKQGWWRWDSGVDQMPATAGRAA